MGESPDQQRNDLYLPLQRSRTTQSILHSRLLVRYAFRQLLDHYLHYVAQLGVEFAIRRVGWSFGFAVCWYFTCCANSCACCCDWRCCLCVPSSYISLLLFGQLLSELSFDLLSTDGKLHPFSYWLLSPRLPETGLLQLISAIIPDQPRPISQQSRLSHYSNQGNLNHEKLDL